MKGIPKISLNNKTIKGHSSGYLMRVKEYEITKEIMRCYEEYKKGKHTKEELNEECIPTCYHFRDFMKNGNIFKYNISIVDNTGWNFNDFIIVSENEAKKFIRRKKLERLTS